MFSNSKDEVVSVRGVLHRKKVILADVNIPYKFSIDRNKNILFFCMNADDFSNQSFQSVVLNLESESATIVPGIRNGFASAVDQTSGQIYLGGSDGIFLYNYITNDIEKTALVGGIDIFDLYHYQNLYFVDTCTQTLHVLRNGKSRAFSYAKGHLIHHFIIDDAGLLFVNPSGLFLMRNGNSTAFLLDPGDMHVRGATVDTFGVPHFIAQDGIYASDMQAMRLEKILSIDNGYGLAFDKKNNIIYGDERSIIKLIHY